MQFSIAALGLLASFTMAQLPAPPYNMCGVVQTDNNTWAPGQYGTIICAIGRVAGHQDKGNVQIPNGESCTTAICHDDTTVDICQTDTKVPVSLTWADIASQVESAFEGCGGVAKSTAKGSVAGYVDPNGSANNVLFQPFQHVEKDWTITVRGQDCSDPNWKNFDLYKC